MTRKKEKAKEGDLGITRRGGGRAVESSREPFPHHEHGREDGIMMRRRRREEKNRNRTRSKQAHYRGETRLAFQL